MFASNSKSGVVSVDSVPILLKEFNNEIEVIADEFDQVAGIASAGNLHLFFLFFDIV